MKRIVTALGLGHLAGLLGWIDPLFIPFALAGPLIAGAVAAALRLPAVWIATFWLSAGLCLLWTDWVVNREDVSFHAVLAVVMALLSLVGWSVVSLVLRLRGRDVGVPA